MGVLHFAVEIGMRNESPDSQWRSTEAAITVLVYRFTLPFTRIRRLGSYS